MKKIALAALLSTFVAAPALADNTGKAYIAGDLGLATYTNTSPFSSPGMMRIAGGFHFSPMLAAEIGYTMFGDSTWNGITLSASSLQIAAVGSLPLNAQFDLIGKLGIANNSEKYADAWGTLASYSQSSLMFGIGAQFHVSRQLSVRAQYEDYGYFDNVPPRMSASTISVGAVYNF
ncbi:MAG TPA: porin family protein [Gallionellaceae bacterium]